MTTPASSPQDLIGTERSSPANKAQSKRWWHILPVTRQERTVTCYDDLGKPKTHGLEQRYVSPTTGVCRKLVVQSVKPKAENEVSIKDHTGNVSKLALWLLSTSPFRGRTFFIWIGVWLLFTLLLLWSVIWVFAQIAADLFLNIDLSDDAFGDSEVCSTGSYKSYARGFSGQLWAARSKREYSIRDRDKEKREENIITHSLHPRLLLIRNPTRDEWFPCTDPNTIMNKKYLAISYRAMDVYTPGPNQEQEKQQFIQEVRNATIENDFDAYWVDLECIGETPDEKNLDVYCMADVYRGADSTLIMLGDAKNGERDAWRRWGGRVWTLPEALLSKRLLYKFRDRSEIDPVSLHHLARMAYAEHELERAIINGYTGKDPLERLERLALLKSAIWRRDIDIPIAPLQTPPETASFSPSSKDTTIEKTLAKGGPHVAERVYALMGFFEHRIQPSYAENEQLALVRLSMANDNDRIVERMVSLLPSIIYQSARWYADDDAYDANLWDIIPEVQVAGVTENGALVLDGCRAASIRWKDFPQINFQKSDSVKRSVIGFIPFFAWPILLVGIVAMLVLSFVIGLALLLVGVMLLLVSPKLFMISQGGRVVRAQPWFIGVKGVLDIDSAVKHLYGDGNAGLHPRLGFTPSGSEFAVPERGSVRGGSGEQYNNAKKAEAEGVQMFTLIDTYASAVYYFRAERPPTVCLFTGREGGLGRFVLCSERCSAGELHKETVLRMPTEVSQTMDMCGWIALG